jgi:hypothetical protein
VNVWVQLVQNDIEGLVSIESVDMLVGHRSIMYGGFDGSMAHFADLAVVAVCVHSTRFEPPR